MSEKKAPISTPESARATGEFDFALPLDPPRRHKNRDLPVKAQKPEQKSSSEPAPGLIPVTQTPDHEIKQEAPARAAKPAPESKAQAKPIQIRGDTETPSIKHHPPHSAHGTPGATLYYTNRKETVAPSEEQTPATTLDQPPIKDLEPVPVEIVSTPAPPASSTDHSPSPLAAPSPSMKTTSTLRAAPVTRTTIPDYRTNIERQSKEQKSIGNLLTILVFSLAAFFIIGTGLAGYGAYVLTKQINHQNVTISDLQTDFANKNNILANQLNDTIHALTKANEQSVQAQAAINQLQDELALARRAAQENTAATLRERTLREADVAELKLEIQRLQNR